MASKATNALAAARAEDLAQVILDGAFLPAQIRDYVRVREKEAGSPWFVAEGAAPLSDSTLRRYLRRADAIIAGSFEHKRGKLLRRHLAQRRNLYARAATLGELSTALSVLKDEAQLQGLYERPVRVPAPGAEKDRATHLRESVAFYQAIRDSSAPTADRMRAQERIDRLMGLELLDVDRRLAALEEALRARDALDRLPPPGEAGGPARRAEPEQEPGAGSSAG
jgi:hypothetical protein